MSDDGPFLPKHQRPHSIYRIFDASGRLLYIGCAEDVQARIYMHRATYTMVDAFLIHRHYDRHTSEVVGPLSDARAAERAAIETERPILNRQHNPTRWRKVAGEYVPVDAETVEALRDLHHIEPNPELVEWFASFKRDTPADTALLESP